MTFDVRPATLADIGFLSSLSREVQQIHADALPRLFKPASDDAYGEEFFRGILADPDGCVLVASWGGKQVGFLRGVILREPETVVRHAWTRLHFKHIGVQPGEHGRGCGHALIAAAVRWARGRGIETITGDVWSFNTRMRAFLAREQHVTYCENQWLDVASYGDA